jgi:hypothetical protein
MKTTTLDAEPETRYRGDDRAHPIPRLAAKRPATLPSHRCHLDPRAIGCKGY